MLCSSALLTQPATSAQPASAVIGQIEEALRARRFDQALELSKRALQQEPRDIRVWTLEGMAYSGLGQLPLAFAAYQQALQLRADYLPALEGASQVAYQQADPAAAPLLGRLLVLRPQDPTAHAMLAIVEARKNKCAAAVEHFAQAGPAIAAQPLAHTRYGVCLEDLHRPADAIEQFRAAAALQPDDAAAYNLALALWNAKRFDEANDALRPAVRPDTHNEEILTLAADIAEARNDTPGAVALLNRAIQSDPHNVKGYLWLANLAGSHSSWQVGIDMLSAGLRLMPREAQLYLARGILYAQMGNFDRASEDFQQAHQLDPHLSFAGTAEGIIASQKHDLNGSIERFRQQVRNHPSSAFDHYLLAESLRQKGAEPDSPEYKEALTAATEAVALDPSLAVAREILADLYLNAGDSNRAAAQCEAVLRQDANNQEALYRLILALRNSPRKNEVPQLTRSLVELRSAQKARAAHAMNYQLTDNVGHPGNAPAAGPRPAPSRP
jgi:tetratricopeptide (TPR) repeat protein